MEGARRIDEWARIAHKIPHLAVVPVLAPIDEDHPSLLDLLPNEWEMLGMIDGQADLRGIALKLGRSEFDVAKIAYGLLSTGIIQVRATETTAVVEPLAGDDPGPHLEQARVALREGRLDDALTAAMTATRADSNVPSTTFLKTVGSPRMTHWASAARKPTRKKAAQI